MTNTRDTAQGPPREGRDRALVIMGKAPRAGSVKTRLSQAHPADAIIALYRCLLEDTLGLARSLADVHVTVMCPRGDATDLRRVCADGVRVVEQRGEGLAAGLDSVFTMSIVAGFRRVVAFNSDSPHLPASVLEAAFEALESRDLVVGPTEDGGYYLIGAKAAHPALFDAGRLGTGGALEALASRARALDLSIGLTEPWYDVDLPEDLARLAADLRRCPERAPRTAALLAASPMFSFPG